MDKSLFKKLVASVRQMDDIAKGKRRPSRTFEIDALAIKEIRAATDLTQTSFARLIQVDVGTLRNWEQGRREPTGPAKALLRAIRNDPHAVIKALAG